MKDIEVIRSLLGSPYFFQEKWACETLYCSSMRSIFDHCDYKVYTKTIVNKNIIDVIDPFPDIFDIFDTLLIFIFLELLIIFDHHDHHGSWMIWMTWMT